MTVAEHLKEFLQWRELNDIAIEDITDTNFRIFYRSSIRSYQQKRNASVVEHRK